MGKSKNKNRSEVEYLRGRIRQLESEIKYLKKREHFYTAPVEEIVDEVESVDAKLCPVCHKGVFSIHDFVYATLGTCDTCGHQERKSKKEKKKG